jgi:hypothetical protein
MTAAALTALCGSAFAQTDGRVDAAVSGDTAAASPQALLGEAWIRYGPTLRSGDYNDVGPGLTYSGTTPNDVGLGVDYFPTLVGGDLRFQREGFSLNAGSDKVASGGLIRAAVGPAGRLTFGLFTWDLMVNYGFAQLPSFAPSASPNFATAQRHSLLLASRGRFDLPFGALAQAEVEYPLVLAVNDSTGGSAKSTGFGVGGSIGWRVAQTGRLGYVARAEYEYVSDSLTQTGGSSCSAAQPCASSQKLSRIGLALEVDYLEAAKPRLPPTGGIVVSVVDDATGAALSGASVDLECGGRHFGLTTAQDGKVAQHDLLAGAVQAHAAAGGYLATDVTADVKPGADVQLVARVHREPPKTGGLAVTLVDKQTQKPLPGVHLKIRNTEYTADDAGQLSLADLPPGPVEIKAALEGYKPGQEVAQVVVGQSSPVVVALVKAEKKQPATISGLVRSTQTGGPVAATLEIPQTKLKASADAKGAFTFELQGGIYRVIISAPGYLTQTKNVTVKEGDEVIFNVDLHPVGR